MDTAEEARDYDSMDHAAVNTRFCDDFLAFASSAAAALGATARVVDFGTGTALIPIALAARAAGFAIVAIDLSEHMLALGRVERGSRRARRSREPRARRREGHALRGRRVRRDDLELDRAPHPRARPRFAEMWRVTAKGGLLFVRDLHRPTTTPRSTVSSRSTQGGRRADPARVASFENQRALFRASLCAALTVAEVARMVAPLGVPASAVTMTSDRHWTLACEKP